jgi:hypothetical protein
MQFYKAVGVLAAPGTSSLDLIAPSWQPVKLATAAYHTNYTYHGAMAFALRELAKTGPLLFLNSMGATRP